MRIGYELRPASGECGPFGKKPSLETLLTLGDRERRWRLEGRAARNTPADAKRTVETEGVTNLTIDMYNIEHDSVDSVFFAVVPDSFMNRSGSVSGKRFAMSETDFADATIATLVAPHDRWSF
jgi:hypothetical protein